MRPTPSYSNRFNVAPSRGNRTEEDEALVVHTHGSLFPFESQVFNSCLPQQQRSRKLKVYSRGNFTTGTDAVGYVVVSPCAASDPPGTVGLFSPGGANHNSFALGAAIGTTNSPYITAAFTNTNIQMRVNSCSLRVRNLTPVLNRGGTLFAFRTPNDTSVLTAPLPINQLVTDLDASGHVCRCDTSGSHWSTISWCPTDIDQMEFVGSSVVASKITGVSALGNIGFYCQAPSNIAVQTYEFEWINHVEIIAGDNAAEQMHSSTRGTAHHLATKVNTIVSELQLRPKVIENQANSGVAGFITDCVKAGHGAERIIKVAEDIIDRTAAIAPRVIAATRALGAFL